MERSEDGRRLPFEPFKSKVVERIPFPSAAERETALERAGFNLFNLKSDEITIDLLTDSGTSAMSDRQWAGLMVGDETYAGSRNFDHFESVVRDLTGFPHIVPAHQGRAAENLLFSLLARPGTTIPNNMHFDTTRSHVMHNGAKAVNLAVAEAYDLDSPFPFKGNMDTQALDGLLRAQGKAGVPLVMMTITNNTGGGQPASLSNLRDVRRVCEKHGVPFYLDMCRWAENAYFIRAREDGMGGRSIREIGREVFALADGATMSAKKDGLVNIGGFVATRDASLFDRLKEQLILFEGFPTYGGLARRDLEATAIGLVEATDLAYLEHRVAQVEYLGRLLEAEGVPFMHPVGGHGIYLDARRFLPHLTKDDLPGQALAVEIYREGAVRTVEVGSIMFGDGESPAGGHEPLEFVRLAIPRRVYSASHLQYVAMCVAAVWRRRDSVRGMRMTFAPERLRHFTARFEPKPARAPVPSAPRTPSRSDPRRARSRTPRA